DRRRAEAAGVAPAMEVGPRLARRDRNVCVQRQPIDEARLAAARRLPRGGRDCRCEIGVARAAEGAAADALRRLDEVAAEQLAVEADPRVPLLALEHAAGESVHG